MKPTKSFTSVCLYGGIVALSGCATMGNTLTGNAPEPLKPYGVQADAPAVIHTVNSTSSPVQKGDIVVSINNHPVNAFSFYTFFRPKSTMKVRDKSGTIHPVKCSAVMLPQQGPEISPLFKGGTFIFSHKISAYGRTQKAGFVILNSLRGLISASTWKDTNPEILEVYIDFHAPADCKDCKLDNIGVMDWGRKSWLSPVPPNKVAWLIYPPDQAAGPLMNVPPPTPVGYASTTTQTGTLNGRTNGNSFIGTYSGIGTTTTTPYYDYTTTNMALAYNLANVLKRGHIQSKNRNRRAFVANRISNLKAGNLTPGEIMTGYMDFVVPKGFTGPYIVVVKAGRRISTVRFTYAKQ